ncbi:Rapamycin-insensitive companion of mTOR, middle domain-domain-containing protein [Kockovaella imperatae]|uniref:Rapamycin-insensitive companion of mTOR, middle domain-domain-containing protein n=1 Tax=Kockovaella imperatae TaxID=4999 RepID=A0A1Y1US55_9TREE|nr:Rapamycin-insensitive companion of mTOR, middle domain-domain-containing protein [Kockovaella imperatae]ORX40861.1 Rapamycin-insensitive companion of mTOR, middle domain-domain-containing protein [Kockovaella imperatae]
MTDSNRSPGRRPGELGRSISTSTSQPALGLRVDDEAGGRSGAEDEETIESLMSRLAIERRVQYGAEKMLDVIEKRSGDADAGDSEQVKERITAQLEAANEHIKALEAKLDKLEPTPSRNRRRPQPRLNGYPSSSSLGLGQSLASSNALSGTSPRPRFPRLNSNLTPDLASQAQFPSTSNLGSPPSSRYYKSLSPSRPRSRSTGEEARIGQGGPLSQSEISSPTGAVDEDRLIRKVEEITTLVRQLRDNQPASEASMEGKGKGKNMETEKVNNAWEALSKIAGMFQRAPILIHSLNMDLVVTSIMPFLGDDSTQALRAASYRALRMCVDRAVWGVMVSLGLEWLIVPTFTRDGKAQSEREQAVRLLRAIVALPPPPHHLTHRKSRRGHQSSRPGHSKRPSISGAESRRHSRQSSNAAYDLDPIEVLLGRTIPLTDGMVRALVSVAENPDDPLRNVCMETLIEIALIDIDCLVRSDAFRILLLVYKDGPIELGPPITTALLHLVDKPSSRQYLLAGSDLETVLVGLTEEYGKVPSKQRDRHLAKLQHCLGNVTILLSSWPGVLYMCMDDCRAFKSLLSSLQAPSTEVRGIVLDLVFSILRIKSPPWMDAFLQGKRLTVYNRTKEATSALQEGIIIEEPAPKLNMADQFIGFLLLVLIKSGLIEGLVNLVNESDFNLARKATLLLGELLRLSTRILPMEYAAHIQSLPRLFGNAMSFADTENRRVALSTLSSIDSLNRNYNRAISRTTKATAKKHATSEDSLERGKRHVEQIKLRQILQMDDKQFQAMINETGVLLGRDHTKWNYEIIMDLIRGPLLNPKRLDEAIKATKFVRRLFSFFHPANNHFSSIKRTRPNHKWVRLGCALLSTMLANPEGVRFVSEDKLIPQLSDCFNELDQYVGVPSIQPLLTKARVETTLTYGYFEMIGTLSKHAEGIKLLEKFKLFTSFYHLSEQRGRDDLMRIIIECFDYTSDAHPRIVLAKALTSAYMETRLFATHHLARLLQEKSYLTDWALQLLITQLYDTSLEVCDVAVMYLEEICSDPAMLEKVVQFRPTLEHLDELGQQLFMRFVSTSAGFSYLHRAGYIERELEAWLEERNLLYVVEAETFISKTLSSTASAEDDWIFEGTAPTHFLGELTKTPEGCQMLRDRGIISEMAELVRLHGMESSDQGLLMNVKSALWALGNIGSTDGGFPFLEDEEIVDAIVEIAELSPILTMKGTAFFVIGLLSLSQVGAQIMEEYGWVACLDPLGKTTGLCYPNDIKKFAQIERWVRVDADPPPQSWGTLDETELEIMTCIAKLSNYVLASGAMTRLKKIRLREPDRFSSLNMFHRAGRLISTNHYQAPVRRFILELFDISIDQETLWALVDLDLDNDQTPHLGKSTLRVIDRDQRQLALASNLLYRITLMMEAI